MQWGDTRTNFFVIPGRTLGSRSTNANATQGDTPLRAVVTLFPLVTILILLAANSHTTDKRVALEARWAGTQGPVILSLAHGTITARCALAWIHTFLRDTCLVKGAVIVLQALV